MDAPDRKDDPVLAEGPVPGDGVVVVRVDERAVDVEDGSWRQAGKAIRANAYRAFAMRAMFFLWFALIFSGIVYFSVIGLTHH
jgi:hypothetical protein